MSPGINSVDLHAALASLLVRPSRFLTSSTMTSFINTWSTKCIVALKKNNTLLKRCEILELFHNCHGCICRYSLFSIYYIMCVHRRFEIIWLETSTHLTLYFLKIFVRLLETSPLNPKYDPPLNTLLLQNKYNNACKAVSITHFIPVI